MEGGREGWERLGGKWTTEVPGPSGDRYERAASTGAHHQPGSNRDAIGDPGAVILDVRSGGVRR